MRNRSTLRGVAGAVASILVLGSCGEGGEETELRAPALLQIVSGDGQTGVAGDPVPERLAVRVLDAAGRPVSGATVYWELAPDGGSLESESSTTNDDGIAENAWRLSVREGVQVGRAWLPGTPTLEFMATATPGAPATAHLPTEGDPLLIHEARTLRVALSDRHGNPVDPAREALTWTVEDPGVARVNDRGVVRAVGPGTTRVEVSAGAAAASAAIDVVRLPPKSGTRTVFGTVNLPGEADSSARYVLTLLGGAAPLETDGFRAEVAADATTLVLLMEDGRTRGMAVVPAPEAGATSPEWRGEIDARSTAASLLYLTPPFGLAPPEISRELLGVIHSLPETEVLARVIASHADAGDRLPTSDDREYRWALLEAYRALVGVLRAGPSESGISPPALGDRDRLLHSGLEFSEPRLDRSGTDAVVELSVRNHALRWVSLYPRPVPDAADPPASAGDGGWMVIPPAAPCPFEVASAAEWFGRCWTGPAAGDPRGSHDLTLTFTPDRPRTVLSLYGPGSGSEGTALPLDTPELVQLPTVMTYAEWGLGSVVRPLAGLRGEDALGIDASTEELERAEDLARWWDARVQVLPPLDRCFGDLGGTVEGPCVKEGLFRHGGQKGWRVLSELGTRLTPSLAEQFTEEELGWLGWEEILAPLLDRTAGVLAQMPAGADRPLAQALRTPVGEDVSLAYNELIGAKEISMLDQAGQNGRTVYPGESLPNPPGVRVTDPEGTPVAEAWVSWEVGVGNGSVGGSVRLVTETDAGGIARADWILGEGEDHQSLLARLAGDEASVEFSASVFRWGHVTTSGTQDCGVGPEGAVYCWSIGTRAPLGTGSQRLEPRPSPALVEPRFLQLSAGPGHTCGLAEGGAVHCWGEGRLGRLGGGSEEATSTPIPILSDLRSFVQVTANGSHTCALSDDGRAYCWGRGESGQLGTGSAGPSYYETVPTRVESDLRFSQLAAGSAHTCALSRDGRAYCWGWGIWGRLGTGSIQSRATPTPVATERTFARIVSGSAHTCALTDDGQAYCWGYGWEGHLGTGTSGRGYEELVPAAVSGDLHFVQLAAGSYHTCGLTREGEAYCWGSGPSLGAGSPEDRAVPTPVRGDHRFVQLAAGVRRTCGVTVEGAAYCWGPGVATVDLETGEAGGFEPVRVEPPQRSAERSIAGGSP